MSAFRTPADEFIPLPLFARSVDDIEDDDEDLDDDSESDEEDEDGPVDESDESVIDDEEEDEEDLDTEEAIDDEEVDEDDEIDEQREELRIRRQQIEDGEIAEGSRREAEGRLIREDDEEACA